MPPKSETEAEVVDHPQQYSAAREFLAAYEAYRIDDGAIAFVPPKELLERVRTELGK